MFTDFILSPIFLLFLIAISFYVQWKVTYVIRKYHKKVNSVDITGYELAKKMLHTHGISNVQVISGQGRWVTDFYDPIKKRVNLSPEVYSGKSISSIAIAAHEIGHAIQHAEGYYPMKVRNLTYPVAQLGSWMGPILLIIGIFMQLNNIFMIGIYFYAAAVLFTVLNLPVEFDASRRAKAYLLNNGLVNSEEKTMVTKLLSAAAMTYVIAALIAIIQLLRMIMFSNRN